MAFLRSLHVEPSVQYTRTTVTTIYLKLSDLYLSVYPQTMTPVNLVILKNILQVFNFI